MANCRPSACTGLGGEIGRRAGLKIPFREECRFDSDPRHQAIGSTPMSDSAPNYPTIEDVIGATPMVRLVRLPGANNTARGNVILGKLEGNNPAGSVKDRPAISMIRRAEERGEIKPGDTLIEATSGNTGIALAMAAAIRGYRMLLVMPEDLSVERAQTMKAFGAELVLTPRSGGMEYA